MKTQRIVITAAVAALTSVALPVGAASGGQHPAEAGCYNIVDGSSAKASGVISTAQAVTDPTDPRITYVKTTEYPNALAVNADIALDAASCTSASYALLEYATDASGTVLSTTPIHTAHVTGSGSGTSIHVTALLDSYSSPCVAVRLETQDGSGYAVDDAPDARSAPIVNCKGGSGGTAYGG